MSTDRAGAPSAERDAQGSRTYLQRFIGRQHRDYRHALADLSEAQLAFCPGPRTNHIAFIAWHVVLSEDLIVHALLLGQPAVWQAEGLAERWGLPPVGQGTGMATVDAQALRLPAVGDFLAYATRVWAATDQYVAELTAAELDRLVTVSPRLAAFLELPDPQLPGRDLLGHLLAHGHQHLGEVWLTRELQGLTGIGV